MELLLLLQVKHGLCVPQHRAVVLREQRWGVGFAADA